LQAHQEAVYALATLRSGELVTGAEDIRVFGRSSRGFELINCVSVEVLCMCTTPGGQDGTQVVTGDMNGLLTVWSTGQEWRAIAKCRGHEKSVWSICYVRDAQMLASGAADNKVLIWDPQTWKCLRELKEHTGWVVGLSSGPGLLLTCSLDKTVRVWDIKRWTRERTFVDQSREVYSVCAFSGGRFATGGAEMSMIVYGGAEHDNEECYSPDPVSPQSADNDRHDDARPSCTPSLGGEESRWDRPSILDNSRPSVQPASALATFEGNCFQQESPGDNYYAPPQSTADWGRQTRDDSISPRQIRDGSVSPLGNVSPRGLSPRGVVSKPIGSRQLEDPADLMFETARAVQRGGATSSSSPRNQQQDPKPIGSVRQIDDPADVLFDTWRATNAGSSDIQRPCSFQVGGQAQVFSASSNCWLRARVTGVDDGKVTVVYSLPDGTEGTKQLSADHEHLRLAEDAKSHVESVTRHMAPLYQVGGDAQVFSASKNCWLRAKVTKVEGDWITLLYTFPDGGEGTKQLMSDHEHLRPPDGESVIPTPPQQPQAPYSCPYRPNGNAQVFSASKNCWLRARITQVENGMVTLVYKFPEGGEGTKQLAIDHEHLRSVQEEPPSANNQGYSASQPQQSSYRIGGEAQVYSASKNIWLRASVTKVEGSMITVVYKFPDGGGGTKELPADHEHLRHAV